MRGNRAEGQRPYRFSAKYWPDFSQKNRPETPPTCKALHAQQASTIKDRTPSAPRAAKPEGQRRAHDAGAIEGDIHPVGNCARAGYQSKARSIPAILTPVKADASKDRARRSSVSRLWTDDLPQALASAVISIVMAVR